MPPGQYRYRLSIMRLTNTRASGGDITPSWAEIVKRWGSVLIAAGSEFEDGTNLHARRQYEVRMRYYSGLIEQDRIDVTVSGKSRQLQVISIATDTGTHQRETVAKCAETDLNPTT